MNDYTRIGINLMESLLSYFRECAVELDNCIVGNKELEKIIFSSADPTDGHFYVNGIKRGGAVYRLETIGLIGKGKRIAANITDHYNIYAFDMWFDDIGDGFVDMRCFVRTEFYGNVKFNTFFDGGAGELKKPTARYLNKIFTRMAKVVESGVLETIHQINPDQVSYIGLGWIDDTYGKDD